MVLLPVLLLVRLVIALQLSRIALRQHLPNLFWLAAYFIIIDIGDVSNASSFAPWLLGIAVGLSEIPLVIFIHQTFYRDQKSPYLIFMGLAILNAIFDIGVSITATKIAPVLNPFSWIWLIVIARQAYKQVAPNPSLDDWVKARYKLIIAYSTMALISTIISILGNVASFVPSLAPVLYNPIVGIPTIGLTIASVVLEYLAWVMPKPYQRFLNRNYKPVNQDFDFSLNMLEEEILS